MEKLFKLNAHAKEFDFNNPINQYCMKECKGLETCKSHIKGMLNGGACRYNEDELKKEHDARMEKLTHRERDKYDSFTAYNRDEIIEQAEKGSIYLHGLYGLGKSHFLRYWQRIKGGRSIYIRSSDYHQALINEIRYHDNTGEYKTPITQRMKDTQYLYYDEIGNEKKTEFMHEHLESVINYRYEHNLPTFITSNYTWQELYNIFADAIGEVKAGQLVSRIKTFGVIEIKGKNWRNEE